MSCPVRNTSILMAIKIVEQCQVSPSEGAAAEQLFPLLYFDIVWLPFPPSQNLIFYNFQCSESLFLETIVPNLKNSLSLALKHFLPLSGKIVYPLSSGLPVSHYVSGEDSVSLAVALCDADLVRLTGNNSKDADEFHDFVPQIPPAAVSSDLIKFPVLAIQVTLFPYQGIAFGFTNQRAICDEANMFGFVQTWALINKFNGDEHLLELGEQVLPSYDRTVLQYFGKLATMLWNNIKLCRPTVSSAISSPTYKVRGTFVLPEVEIKKLKRFVLNKKLGMPHVSSFVIVCGLVWICLAKSTAAVGEEVADDEIEYLSCSVDCRARLSPTLPDTYFGNCLTLVHAESSHGRLRGKEGFVAAAEAIAVAIDRTVDNDTGILYGLDSRFQARKELAGKRVLGVDITQIFDVCLADFGWGGPKKLEAVSIDYSDTIFLCKSKEGVEIGLSMPKIKMDAFAAIFNDGVEKQHQNMCTKSRL